MDKGVLCRETLDAWKAFFIYRGKKAVFMEFSELFKKIEYKLRFLARKYRTRCSYFDEEDLYQEMCGYLWRTYKDGLPYYLNESYVVRGCEFHILNYMRKEREKVYKISLEAPINENGDTLKENLPSGAESLDRAVDKKMLVNYIMNNGFSKREKDVFGLLLEGHTVREAGQRLGISHVMVVKLKNRLINKAREAISYGTK